GRRSSGLLGSEFWFTAAPREEADGLEIPSFFILESSVVRLSPNREAAPRGPPIAHPAPRKACKMIARWESMNVPGVACGPIGTETGGLAMKRFASGIGKGFGRTPSWHRITARSTRF